MGDFYRGDFYGETLSDDDLISIRDGLRAEKVRWSELAVDDNYLSRAADARMREHKAHYDSVFDNDPEGREEHREFLKGEIMRECRSRVDRHQKLMDLFWRCYSDRREWRERRRVTA
tara:strand:+ start:369 stop:719 length:351 start_codon:yes stop_codon:yes gene_type:complete